jgi:hypothetical protein
MKVGWVQNVPMTRLGGQTLGSLKVLEATPSGVEVVICTPEEFDAGCDAYVIVSPVESSRTQIELLKRSPRIIWARDLWILPTDKVWIHDEIPALCKSAAANLFTTPLFRDTFIQQNAAGLHLSQTGLALTALDPDPFLAVRGTGSREGNLWVGDFNNYYKGLRAAVDWCAGRFERLAVLGYGNEPPPYLLAGKYSEWVDLLEPVPFEDMPALYAEFERLVCKPNGLEPAGRAVMEAALAGLEIEADAEVVGVMSYDWWGDVERLAQELRDAPRNFWALAYPALVASIKARDCCGDKYSRRAGLV